ncbi:MAG: glycosyltransferase [Desulfuromonadales bacterium]
MREAKISVIITCYNYGRFLGGCIDSVLRQSYGNREIILIDDGSTDDTPVVASRYLGRADFRYVRQENAGQAHAKNAGIRLASGDLVAFLDADDLWTPEKLSLQAPLFTNPDTGVVYSRMQGIDEEGRTLPIEDANPYLRPQRGKVTEKLFFDNFVPFSSSMVRRRCFERDEFDASLAMGIDWDLWLRLSTRWNFDYIDSPLLYYRTGHADQMSRKQELRQLCTDRIRDRFLDRYPQLLPPRLVRQVFCHSHCCRGFHYRHLDRGRALAHYLTALRYRKFAVSAYRGLFKTLITQAMTHER